MWRSLRGFELETLTFFTASEFTPESHAGKLEGDPVLPLGFCFFGFTFQGLLVAVKLREGNIFFLKTDIKSIQFIIPGNSL